MVAIALDSSFGDVSVAILTADGRGFSDVRRPERGGADELVAMIAAGFAAVGLTGPDLTEIFVTSGPGTFTGQRAAIAAAQGLQVASGADAFLFSSLHAMALTAGTDGPTIVLVDARRGGAYLQSFNEALSPLAPPRLMPVAAAIDEASAFRGTCLTPNPSWLSDTDPALAATAQPIGPPAIRAEVFLGAAERLSLAPASKIRPDYLRPPDAAPSQPLPRA
ncbi:MAG: tRNA (adenosine(37)-N6)-threonylcarbamoyltransferase complex dimerization subunit type 1 TsaB [Pseudomonadota bacterium]